MGFRAISLLLSAVLLAGSISAPQGKGANLEIRQGQAGQESIKETDTEASSRKEEKEEQEKQEQEKEGVEAKAEKEQEEILAKPEGEGQPKDRRAEKSTRKEQKGDAKGEEVPEQSAVMQERYNTEHDYYSEQQDFVNKNGHFYIFLRKEGEKVEEGRWYKILMNVNSLTSFASQKVGWGMFYLEQQKGDVANIEHWKWTNRAAIKDNDPFFFDVETGKAWEKTGQNSMGAAPVLGTSGIPSHTNGYYFKLCGKFLCGYQGYQIAFDESIYKDLDGFDIEPENKKIQKPDKSLGKDEKPWTGDGYFKFAIDTNNTGMTNFGTTGKFHNAVFGFKLVPNQYTVKYDANGGTGTMANHSETYGQAFHLKKNKFTRPGYTFMGWSMGKEEWACFQDGQEVMDLTSIQHGTATLYAQWRPNTVTVKYHANGGSVLGSPKLDINSHASIWNYATEPKKPAKVSSFGLEKEGYGKKTGAEWNTKADGTGTAFQEGQAYEMLDYAPDLKTGNRSVLLYAQWQPKIYTITLNHHLPSPAEAGTGKIYEKYENGWYLDKNCANPLKDRFKTASISIPKQTGYVFQGYYNAAAGGTQMIDAKGRMTSAGIKDYKHIGDAVWHAHYTYQISCEDYADVPCDFEKTEGDAREQAGAVIRFDKATKAVRVETGFTGFSATFIGKPAGTKVGKFLSTSTGASSSGFAGNGVTAVLAMVPVEGAAYQCKVTAQGRAVFDRTVYFKDGRFRTLVKLGAKGEKEAAPGSSIAGNVWGTADASYPLYLYQGCSELKNIQAPGVVCRYFQYKKVNMAYSGNGATSGNNILEYNVPLERLYQIRKNGFSREEIQEKQAQNGKKYQCNVKFRFQGWELSEKKSYQEQQQEPAVSIYRQAQADHVLSGQTAEPIGNYHPVGVGQGAGGAEFINFLARWNAYPTIAVTPGKQLEFYEGEEVTKEKLVGCLTAHDGEDNKHAGCPDLNSKVRIIKIKYPSPKNKSQAAYEKTYQEDVPANFLLDTYYLKLEKEERVEVMVTFAVTDKDGNTTEEEFPVIVKYNHYPQISSEEVFYYLKEEVNRGEVTEGGLLRRATAKDIEDGDVTGKLKLKDFDVRAVKMQTEPNSEFEAVYQVTDAYKKASYKVVKLVVVDEDAVVAELPNYYVRYISEKHLGTLEENSTWREPDNYKYLVKVLGNQEPMETWLFTHEDVLAVKEWVTEDGAGNWKNGKGANQEFLAKFSYCKQ